MTGIYELGAFLQNGFGNRACADGACPPGFDQINTAGDDVNHTLRVCVIGGACGDGRGKIMAQYWHGAHSGCVCLRDIVNAVIWQIQRQMSGIAQPHKWQTFAQLIPRLLRHLWPNARRFTTCQNDGFCHLYTIRASSRRFSKYPFAKLSRR